MSKFLLSNTILGAAVFGMSGLALADTIDTTNTIDAPTTQSCPATFFDVSLMSNARQCQQFDDSLPASMVYFTKQKPDDVIAFYQNAYPQFVRKTPVNQRTMLASTDDSIRIVVSPDNMGTQVDVLIISKE
ncbi:hypothetical protein Q4561_09230 [Alteromonas sp. 1_MG-2023]|uniref:hypothetical protein n=1 Tax=Alteromonas sp. 1_MG-2023 TaxID=3062669 RepID=UPI0026E3145E|nr:hypothetical protein [Alteromonas sp. 1_MG-2023]MDO6567238.1 hypothetical protein [Alteromonas sp. 1_MG-2023]